MKVKFTKLAALLLAGAALLASGCTDYEVDIQKANQRIDQLDKDKATIAELNSQIDALKTLLSTTYETISAHESDAQAIRKQITDLEDALKKDYQQKIQDAVNTLTTEINKKVNQADYDVDKAAIQKAIKDVNDALDAAKDRIKAIEDADFQKQIDNLTTAMQNALNTINNRLADLEQNKADKEQVAKDIAAAKAELEQKIADAEAELNGKINALELRVKANEDAIKDIKENLIPGLQDQIDELNNVVIPEINKKIKELQDGKLDRAEFDTYYKNAYEKYTKATIDLIQADIKDLQALTAGFPDDTTIKEYIDAADKALQDDITAKYLTLVAAAFGTEENLKNLQGNLLGRIEVLEALLEGDWGDDTVKEYIDKKVKNLQDQIDDIVNNKLPELDRRVTALEASMDTVLETLEFCAVEDEDGNITYDLQGYIDAAAQDAYESACEYTDEYIEWLIDEINEALESLYDYLNARINLALSRIQSIQFVPEYDDLKITSNMAWFTQPGSDFALAVDQPTQVTYQFLPAQYAQDVADGIQALVCDWQDSEYGPYTREECKEWGMDGILAWFDVRPVGTRADEADDTAPEFKIMSVDKVDTATGEITFTVQPVNVASASFQANGLKPVENVYMTAETYDPYYGIESFGLFDDGESWGWYNRSTSSSWAYYVFNIDDLKAFENRAAFAAQLRLYHWQDFDYNEDAFTYDDEGYIVDIDWDNLYIDFENELASPYNVLYPAVHEINVEDEPYKKEEDEDGNVTVRPFTRDEYHQKLPYNTLRGDEGDDPIPYDYRIILDQAVPVVTIDGGEPMTLEQAAEAGYLVPAITTAFDNFEILKNTATSAVNPKNFILTEKVYAEVEMNGAEPASNRKLAIGNLIVGTYKFSSVLGDFTAAGDVLITKESGTLDVDAEIVWDWSEDAVVDHNLFYETGEDPTTYNRTQYQVNINAASMEALGTRLGLNLESFNEGTMTSIEVYVADRPADPAEGEDPVAPAFSDTPDYTALPTDEGFDIQNLTIDGTKLYADIINFEWDKAYKFVAVYDLPYAEITVTGLLTTVDRNREKVVLPVIDYTFDINGEDYQLVDPVEDSWYKWVSDPQHKPIFQAFVDNGVINVKDNVDFVFDADQDDFNAGELEGFLRMADPSGTAAGYIDFDRDEIVLKTLPSFKASVLKSELFNSGEQDPEDPYRFVGNIVTRNVTTYIGEEVEIQIRLSYRVPAYDFLHQTNYTFNDNVWYTMASPKYWYNKKALAHYDVEYMNVPALAFNIIDKNGRFFNFKDVVDNATDETYFYDENLFINFFYTPGAEVQDETELEDQSKTTDWNGSAIDYYGDLWFNSYEEGPYYDVYEARNFEHAVFYYRSVRDAIKMYGTLQVASGDARFDIPTSFEVGSKGKYVASEVVGDPGVEYSDFELRAWKPFFVPTYDQTLTIDLDEHKFYYVNVLEGLQFYDARQVKASADAIEIDGTDPDDVAAKFAGEGTYSIKGFNYGVKADLRPMLGFSTYYSPRAPYRDNQFDPEKGYWSWIVGNTDEAGKGYTYDYENDEFVLDENAHPNGFYKGVSSWDAYDFQMNNFVFDDRTGVPQDLRRLIDVNEQGYFMRFDYNSQIQFTGTAEIDFSFDFQTPWQAFVNEDGEPQFFNVKVILRGLDQQ